MYGVYMDMILHFAETNYIAIYIGNIIATDQMLTIG